MAASAGTVGPATSRTSAPRAPAGRRVTIRDVAEAAAVSRSTASRALTGNGYVAEAVRGRVHDVAQALGYVPDATAQHLRRRVSNSLGLVVSNLANPFYAELAAGAARQARHRGYTMMLIDDGAPTGDPATARALVQMRVAGAILTPVSPDLGAYLREHDIPTVEVDRQFAEGLSDAVVVDNTRGARQVTTRLAELGHRRIALFIDETHWTTGRDRHAGYRQALEEAGIRPDPALVVSSGWDVDVARARAAALLADPDHPTAVFAANNVLAEGVWRASADLGLTIPDDLSLVSFDDAPWMSMVTPGITAVAQDAVAIGSAAVDLLLDRLAAPDAPPRTEVVPALVVRRGSTAAPPEGRPIAR
ncbi:substrate-binding domain-containing protein [Georgenia subflava]|uniref:Substrate-binding domain-containing protein n=1 Tax=Georgenia subflava TaxID=1622177 RepID=A0A6N7EN65_9MICO|nr:substrate-binding domain-containing protein [Georgenia subflava]